MFADYTENSEDEYLLSVLKLEKDECLLSVLKLEKMNVCWVY